MKMLEITKQKAIERNLKLIGRINGKDMSKIILMMERLKENKKIKYYIIESIIYNEKTQEGNIIVSFWTDA
jgi:hypothetical protein